MVRYICNFLSCGIGYGAGTIILIDLYGLRIKLVVAVRIFMYNIFKHMSIIIINNIYLESSVFCFFFSLSNRVPKYYNMHTLREPKKCSMRSFLTNNNCVFALCNSCYTCTTWFAVLIAHTCGIVQLKH